MGSTSLASAKAMNSDASQSENSKDVENIAYLYRSFQELCDVYDSESKSLSIIEKTKAMNELSFVYYYTRAMAEQLNTSELNRFYSLVGENKTLIPSQTVPSKKKWISIVVCLGAGVFIH